MIKRRGFLFGLAAAASAHAVAAPPPYRVRLIAGEPNSATWTAGVDIELDEHWKTYWRVPGEGGIPPSFDWTGSTHVKSIDVLWPAPQRFNDASGETIGYARRVVFPLRIAAESAQAIPELRLAMFFGVCKEICIPARYTGSLALGQAAPADLSLLQTYLSRVPERRPFIQTASIVEGALKLSLMDNVPASPELFVESDTLAYFRAPRANGHGYALPIDGLKDTNLLRGKTLRVTLVAGEHRLEQDVTVE
jgi:DsbC/DsbD-like thiol-disulfide interchange protein